MFFFDLTSVNRREWSVLSYGGLRAPKRRGYIKRKIVLGVTFHIHVEPHVVNNGITWSRPLLSLKWLLAADSLNLPFVGHTHNMSSTRHFPVPSCRLSGQLLLERCRFLTCHLLCCWLKALNPDHLCTFYTEQPGATVLPWSGCVKRVYNSFTWLSLLLPSYLLWPVLGKNKFKSYSVRYKITAIK